MQVRLSKATAKLVRAEVAEVNRVKPDESMRGEKQASCSSVVNAIVFLALRARNIRKQSSKKCP